MNNEYKSTVQIGDKKIGFNSTSKYTFDISDLNLPVLDNSTLESLMPKNISSLKMTGLSKSGRRLASVTIETTDSPVNAITDTYKMLENYVESIGSDQ